MGAHGRLAVTMACGAALAACNGTSLQDFQDRVASVRCRHAATCGAIGRSEEQACEAAARTARARYPDFYSRADAIDAGRLAYDSAAARACSDAAETFLAHDACNPFFDADAFLATAPACAGVFRGRVAPGGQCLSPIECADGWCGGNRGVEGCRGSCRPFVDTGEPCPDGQGCRPDDVCDVFNGSVCRAARRPGDPVGASVRADEGGACVTSLGCAAGLGCTGPFVFSGSGPPQGTCRRFLDVGEACDPAIQYSGCAGDLVCDAKTRTCRPLPGEGEPCDWGAGCAGEYLYCDGAGRCRALVPLEGSCSWETWCQQGACVRTDTGVCRVTCPSS